MSTDIREFDLEGFKQQIGSGANWFYWIAGLSFINLLIMLGDGNIHFIVGSSFVEFCAAVGKEGGSVGYVGSFFVLGLFLFLGRFANRPVKWAFMLGMVVYALDGFLYVAFEDILPALFHVYVLFRLYKGMSAVTPYLELRQDLADNPHMQVIPVTASEEFGANDMEANALPSAGE